MPKHVCDACGKRIKEGTAYLVVNTATSSQRWHTECCPLIPKLEPAPAGQEGDRAAPRPST